MSYYLPAKTQPNQGYVVKSELRRQKRRDLQVPFYRRGRWRGYGTKRLAGWRS